MHAGRVAWCPLVSHGDRQTDERTDGRTPDRYTTLSARRGQRKKQATPITSGFPVTDVERIRLLVGVNLSSFLQCFDTAGWIPVTGWASGLLTCVHLSQKFSSGTDARKKKTEDPNHQTLLHLERPLKQKYQFCFLLLADFLFGITILQFGVECSISSSIIMSFRQ